MASRDERSPVFALDAVGYYERMAKSTGRKGLVTVLISLSPHRAIADAIGERVRTRPEGDCPRAFTDSPTYSDIWP
jgi:hypothetical protein